VRALRLTLPWVFLVPAAFADSYDPARVARLVMDEANAFRREHRLSALENDERLTRTARDFAEFMARTDKFSHEADGSQPADRARRHGYDYCMVAENLGYQFRSLGFASIDELAHGFVEGWRKSHGHRKNLLDREPTETGVAVARSAKTGRYYAVQLFGHPASKSIVFSVANESGRPVEYRLGSEKFALPPRSMRTHQQCAPDAVSFEGETLAPRNGDRIVVAGERGTLHMRRQGG
jgi:hypothetical protein